MTRPPSKSSTTVESFLNDYHDNSLVTYAINDLKFATEEKSSEMLNQFKIQSFKESQKMAEIPYYLKNFSETINELGIKIMEMSSLPYIQSRKTRSNSWTTIEILSNDYPEIISEMIVVNNLESLTEGEPSVPFSHLTKPHNKSSTKDELFFDDYLEIISQVIVVNKSKTKIETKPSEPFFLPIKSPYEPSTTIEVLSRDFFEIFSEVNGLETTTKSSKKLIQSPANEPSAMVKASPDHLDINDLGNQIKDKFYKPLIISTETTYDYFLDGFSEKCNITELRTTDKKNLWKF